MSSARWVCIARLWEAGPRLTLGAVVVLGLLAYRQVADHEFILFDDPAITEHPLVRQGLTREGMLWALTNTTYYDYWHPLTWITHMLDFEIFEDNAGGHHVSNLIYHLSAAAVAYAALARLTKARWPAAGVAALLALHPVHVESVAWVVQRKDVLAGLMFFVTLWLYVLYRERRTVVRYLLLTASYVLGLSAKPMLVTLPFVLLLIDYWVTATAPHNLLPNTRNWQVLVIEKVPLLVLAAVAAAFTYVTVAGKGALSGPTVQTIGFRTANVFLAYAGYLRRLVAPVGLSVLYPRRESLPVWETAWAFMLITALSAGAWTVRKRHPCVLIGWLWFLGVLVPVIGIVETGMQSLADRFLYIPAVGLYIAVCFGVWGMFPRLSVALKRAVTATGIVVCICLSLATRRQAAYWRTSETLFRRAVQVNSRCYPILNNLGTLFMEQGRIEEAGEVLRAAAAAAPHDWIPIGNLGSWYLQRGDTANARRAYEKALLLNPHFAEAHLGLARILHSQGLDSLALRLVWSAARCQPENWINWRKAAAEMAAFGDLKSARTLYLRAAEIAPHAWEPLAGLGQVELLERNVGASLVWYKAALDLKPPVPFPYVGAGMAALGAGLAQEARELFARALEMKPGMCEAVAGMALALCTVGDCDSALGYLRTVRPGAAECPQMRRVRDVVRKKSVVVDTTALNRLLDKEHSSRFLGGGGKLRR